MHFLNISTAKPRLEAMGSQKLKRAFCYAEVLMVEGEALSVRPTSQRIKRSLSVLLKETEREEGLALEETSWGRNRKKNWKSSKARAPTGHIEREECEQNRCVRTSLLNKLGSTIAKNKSLSSEYVANYLEKKGLGQLEQYQLTCLYFISYGEKLLKTGKWLTLDWELALSL